MSFTKKIYAVVFRHDQDKKPELVEINKVIDDDGCYDFVPPIAEVIRLPEDRYYESSRISTGPMNGNIKGQFYCDDKPSEACARDKDANHSGWHPRMFGDFCFIVESEKEAKWLVGNATPMVWFP